MTLDMQKKAKNVKECFLFFGSFLVEGEVYISQGFLEKTSGTHTQRERKREKGRVRDRDTD